MTQDHLLTTEPTSKPSQLLREIHVASEYIELLTIPFIRWHERDNSRPRGLTVRIPQAAENGEIFRLEGRSESAPLIRLPKGKKPGGEMSPPIAGEIMHGVLIPALPRAVTWRPFSNYQTPLHFGFVRVPPR